MSKLNPKDWSAYWKSGALTTFQDAFPGNYDGAIEAFWHELFENLPNKATAVDLACGNGALALLAAEFSETHGKDLDIKAIDFAKIAPPEDERTARYVRNIEFHGETRIEATGLPPASVDLAMSQFGVEYGDRDAVASEVDRILRPEGSMLVALVHHDDSDVIRTARTNLENIVACSGSEAPRLAALLQQAVDKARSAGAEPSNSPECEDLRMALNGAVEKLQEMAARSAEPRYFEFFIRSCMSPFSTTAMRTLTLEQRLGLLDTAREETVAFRRRVEDLLAAALSAAAVESWIDAYKARGFELTSSGPVAYKGQYFAYKLLFAR